MHWRHIELILRQESNHKCWQLLTLGYQNVDWRGGFEKWKTIGIFLGGEKYCRKAMKINQSVQRGRPPDLGHC